MYQKLPFFPLPDTVLFPRTHLPLHIFEPRYRQMIEDAMAGKQKIAIANLKEGYETDYFGAPPVYRMMTSARILIADKLEDGRWNILVEGIERVRLVEEVQQEPYRIGHLAPFVERAEEWERAEVIGMMRHVATVAESLGQHFDAARRVLSNLVNTHQHPSVVCDIIAGMLVKDPYSRQSLLEETNLYRRLQLLNIQLHQLADHLRANGIPVDIPALD